MGDEADIWNEGRRELVVQFIDGSSEKIIIKKVSYRKMADYAATMGNDTKQALAVLEEEKDEKWLDRLTDESFADIVEKGDEVNDPLFERWWKRAKRLVKRDGDFRELVSDAVSHSLSNQDSKPSDS